MKNILESIQNSNNKSLLKKILNFDETYQQFDEILEEYFSNRKNVEVCTMHDEYVYVYIQASNTKRKELRFVSDINETSDLIETILSIEKELTCTI